MKTLSKARFNLILFSNRHYWKSSKKRIIATLRFLSLFPKIWLMVSVIIGCKNSKNIIEKKTFPNDPFNLHYYKLKNGLSIYILPNFEEPKVWLTTIVRAGGKYDPPDNTGLAHYLEHLLFKGNKKIGTINYEAEKTLLDQITELYEQLKGAQTEEERMQIFKKIDSLSQEAAKYAIPNEFDKIASYLGASFTNAYTAWDNTAYLLEVPATEFEKTIMLEKERFTEPVFRLFHTELETVYEEFNRTEDDDYRRSWIRLLKLLFPNHPYGTQTIIGLGEHLKKPSIKKVQEYFNTYYVPSNMAIIVAGHVNPDSAIKIIEKYWADLPDKNVPKTEYPPLEPLNGVKVDTIYGPFPPYAMIGYRLPPATHPDIYPLYLAVALLSNNGQTGLIDVNLLLSQKVLEADAYIMDMKDHSCLIISGTAKQGQSSKEVVSLLLEQIEKLKKGEFEDWLIKAIVDNMEFEQKRQWKSNTFLATLAGKAFVLEKNWSEIIDLFNILRKITKEQIVNIANKYFGDEYVVIYKELGTPTDIHKVKKPPITPIPIKRGLESEFFKQMKKIPSPRLTPRFVDFSKDMIQLPINNNSSKLYYVKNSIPDIFTLNFVIEYGKFHDKKMPFAARYFNLTDSKNLTQEAFRKELYKHAVSLDIYVEDEETYITISGLEKNLTKALPIIFDFIKNTVPNKEKFDEMIKDILKERENNLKEKRVILWEALRSFLIWGGIDNPFTYTLKNQELTQQITAEQLITLLKNIFQYPVEVSFIGNMPPQEVKSIIEQNYPFPSQFTAPPSKKTFKEASINNNVFYLVDYPQKQIEILMTRPIEQFNASLLPYRALYNEYYGSGLSSVVFQEIREARGLAYAASTRISVPNDKDHFFNFVGYIGTQSDKFNEALSVATNILSEMIKGKEQFEAAKLAALKDIESSIVKPTEIYNLYRKNRKLGVDYDLRKDVYKEIQRISLEDFEKFFNEKIANKKYSIGLIGDIKSIDSNFLSKYGEIKKVSVEYLFNY